MPFYMNLLLTARLTNFVGKSVGDQSSEHELHEEWRYSEEERCKLKCCFRSLVWFEREKLIRPIEQTGLVSLHLL